ncbi:phosphatase PAP2 family protein [Bradyrhizobium lablabi]|uniref:phosphatase PAP2 family protein n=1 Tax=Bradyrhizobium lablabi TaxID=722472 RepID=UPI001BA48A48|nr:phosphatase PAP2 family protein [Bradyrhizobium lablabi]MBR0696607.1 phosphatase PAP2 family protein [Bradyrhizobium lablabi]
MLDGNWDRELLLTLNSLVGLDGPHYVWGLASNALFRGFPIFFAWFVLWFSRDCIRRRSRMLVALLAVCLATVLSVWLQFHLATHTRPILDPALHLNIIDPGSNWDRTGSFPSDTATVFFALATVILLENRVVGLICLLWVAAVIAIPRVVVGWHYPSDVVGSLLLGPGFVLLFDKVPYLRMLFERSLRLFEGRMYLVHALLFVLMADASHLFDGLQHAGKSLVRMLGS